MYVGLGLLICLLSFSLEAAELTKISKKRSLIFLKLSEEEKKLEPFILGEKLTLWQGAFQLEGEVYKLDVGENAIIVKLSSTENVEKGSYEIQVERSNKYLPSAKSLSDKSEQLMQQAVELLFENENSPYKIEKQLSLLEEKIPASKFTLVETSKLLFRLKAGRLDFRRSSAKNTPEFAPVSTKRSSNRKEIIFLKKIEESIFLGASYESYEISPESFGSETTKTTEEQRIGISWKAFDYLSIGADLISTALLEGDNTLLAYTHLEPSIRLSYDRMSLNLSLRQTKRSDFTNEAISYTSLDWPKTLGYIRIEASYFPPDSNSLFRFHLQQNRSEPRGYDRDGADLTNSIDFALAMEKIIKKNTRIKALFERQSEKYDSEAFARADLVSNLNYKLGLEIQPNPQQQVGILLHYKQGTDTVADAYERIIARNLEFSYAYTF